MSDLISRRAAISLIECHMRTAEEPYQLTMKNTFMNHAFNVAMSCLMKLPSVQQDLQPTCNQLATNSISRQAALDAVNRATTKEAARWSIQELPSTELKTGKWVREKRFYKSEHGIDFEYFIEHCSECGARRRIGWQCVAFCPNCGARMEVE